MGSASSKQPVTPARPLRNKHLSHVSDPRSPTSGIPRTPIEVEQVSNRVTPQVVEVVEVGQEVAAPCSSDPRSPTPGISRTPLRPTVTATLHSFVKQLSQAFTYEEGTKLKAEEGNRVLLHPSEEHCKSSLETEKAQQATEFFRATSSREMRPELTHSEAEQATTCWQCSEDCLKMEKNLTQASAEEVEVAMGLLRLADECQSMENKVVHSSPEMADMQLGLACMDMPLAKLDGSSTENSLDGKDEQSVDDLCFRDDDGLTEKLMFKVSRAEELELAGSLLTLVDLVKRDEETGLCTSPTEVVEHTETVGPIECQAKEELGPQTHSCMEPLKTDFLQAKELQLEENTDSVFSEASSEVPTSLEAVLATRPPSSASRTSGMKAPRQRPRKMKGKVLSVPASHGRSPLRILSDDNSPSTLAHKQVKKALALSDGSVERTDSTSRPLKIVRSWEDVHNKENARYTEVEN